MEKSKEFVLLMSRLDYAKAVFVDEEEGNTYPTEFKWFIRGVVNVGSVMLPADEYFKLSDYEDAIIKEYNLE